VAPAIISGIASVISTAVKGSGDDKAEIEENVEKIVEAITQDQQEQTEQTMGSNVLEPPSDISDRASIVNRIKTDARVLQGRALPMMDPDELFIDQMSKLNNLKAQIKNDFINREQSGSALFLTGQNYDTSVENIYGIVKRIIRDEYGLLPITQDAAQKKMI